jgi:hypothetical protein
MHYLIETNSPSPDEVTSLKKKKKEPGKRDLLLGFIFFANIFPLAGKGKQLSSAVHPPRKKGCEEEAKRAVNGTSESF